MLKRIHTALSICIALFVSSCGGQNPTPTSTADLQATVSAQSTTIADLSSKNSQATTVAASANTFSATPTAPTTQMSEVTSTPINTSTGASTGLISERHFEPDWGFSYVPPQGWHSENPVGIPRKRIVGPRVSGFPVPLTVEFSRFEAPETLAELAEKFLQILASHSAINITGPVTMKTIEGKLALKIVFDQKLGDYGIAHTTYYLLEYGNLKFMAEYVRLADKGSENDLLIEQCIEGLQFK